MKSMQQCKLHRIVDYKESNKKIFEIIYLMLFDNNVHLWSVFFQNCCFKCSGRLSLV